LSLNKIRVDCKGHELDTTNAMWISKLHEAP
jgi:hypothetical protein